MNEPWIDVVPPGPIGNVVPTGEGQTFSKKVFAKPFHLVFKKPNDQEVTWIKVETLGGLKNVTERVANGELIPINAWSTLDRQLWGLLAEHVGFLRYGGPAGHLHDGIQPAGQEQADLVGDMTELFGGFEPAIEAISAMRERALEALNDEFEGGGISPFKDDGVNLTGEAEEVLAKEFYGELSKGNLQVKMDAANAEVLTRDTDIDDSPIGDAIAEIDAEHRELRTFSADEIDDEQKKALEDLERRRNAADGDEG